MLAARLVAIRPSNSTVERNDQQSNDGNYDSGQQQIAAAGQEPQQPRFDGHDTPRLD